MWSSYVDVGPYNGFFEMNTKIGKFDCWVTSSDKLNLIAECDIWDLTIDHIENVHQATDLFEKKYWARYYLLFTVQVERRSRFCWKASQKQLWLWDNHLSMFKTDGYQSPLEIFKLETYQRKKFSIWFAWSWTMWIMSILNVNDERSNWV